MLKIIHATLATWYVVTAAFPPSLRHPLKAAINNIDAISVSCDAQNLNISATLQQPFKGVLFAKDFSQECKSFGTQSKYIMLNLPTSGCGVRLSSDSNGQVYYRIWIVVQQDRFLKQITDQERVISCNLQENALAIKSLPMAEALKSSLNQDHKDHRTGRMKDEGWSKDFEKDKSESEQEVIEALSAARAWMEVIPENGKHLDTLQVGEPALLVVKSTLPVGIGWKVVNCMAHDGLGDSSQKLLDENGCPVDEVLMPAPLLGPPRPIALMRYQEAVSRFSAFKFPDRERLHLSCSLQLCRGACDKVICSSLNNTEINENRLGRTFSSNPGEVLDRLDVFNSVEVVAPGIDLEEVREVAKNRINEQLGPFANLPGDRTFCVSTDKMAVTFAILGLIFLCAVVVSVCALMKARRSSEGLPYYTRSLFSSSSGGSRFSGSKLLLQDNPCLNNPVQTSLPYGRVF